MPDRGLLSLLKPRSGNPYAIGGFSPKLITSLIEQGAKGELLAESKTLLPDEATMSKSIMDRDIFAGDKARYINGLSQYTSQFLSEYKKDPYYAFTKDARGKIKQMKAIASDPRLIAMEQAKKTSDAEYEKAQQEGLDFNPVVSNGRVDVVRNGRIQSIPLSQLEDTDTPVSVRQRYESAVNSGIGTTPISYDMTKWADVIDKVQSVATNLGVEGIEQGIGTGLVKRIKTQGGTYNERLKWLLSNGFSQADINSIQSEYMKRSGSVGPNTHIESLKWMADLASKHLHSSLDYSEVTSVDPALQARKTTAETLSLTAPVGSYEAMLVGATSMVNQKLTQEGGDPAKTNVTVELSPTMWTNMGEKVGNTLTSFGEMPSDINPIIRAFRKDPSAPLVTLDGIVIEEGNAVPDLTRNPEVVWENGKRYLHMPMTYATDEYTNSVFDQSVFAGAYNPETKSFEKKSVGESGEFGNTLEAHYSKIASIIRDDDLFPDYVMPHEKGFEFFDDNLYQITVKMEMHPEAEHRARLELDKFNLYAPKEVESAFPVQNTGARRQMITR